MEDFQLIETHVSWLLLTKEHVYKIKKPVVFGFLDLSTPEARTAVCQAEVLLNRRLAPDVYEGVATFCQPDGRVEPVVVMRRLPAETSLAALVDSGDRDLEGRVREVAVAVADFHRTARRDADIDRACRASEVTLLWQRNLAELRLVASPNLDPGMIDQAEDLAVSYLAGREELLDSRIAAGQAVDGHGDLLCDDIFSLGDGPRILDCLEFSDSLRYGDTLSDLASLAMDLEYRGRVDLAASFLHEYRQQTGDWWPPSLAGLYIAYRATVRAKVACIRALAATGTQSQVEATKAGDLMSLAIRHLLAGRPRLILVGGLPGTGKTTLARELQAATGWRLLSSDVLRKRLAGIELTQSAEAAFGTGLYTSGSTAANYTELLDEAEILLRGGDSVILDASWLRRCWRESAELVARGNFADLIEVRCVTSRDVAADRILKRHAAGPGPSDATPAVADAMADAMEPWTEAMTVDTEAAAQDTLAQALAAVGSY